MALALVFIQTQETGHFEMNVHDVKNLSINEQKQAVLARFVNSILYLHKNSRNAIREYVHIIAPHVLSIFTFGRVV